MPETTDVKTAPQPRGKTMWVVSNLDNDRVALWEPDTSHPGGEVYVAGKVPAEAALTPEVNKRLREGTLREASDAEIAKRKAQLGAAAVEAPKGLWD